MPPHPEVPATLRRLRDHGFRLFTLTDNTLEISGRQWWLAMLDLPASAELPGLHAAAQNHAAGGRALRWLRP
jgi:hypothetical protein